MECILCSFISLWQTEIRKRVDCRSLLIQIIFTHRKISLVIFDPSDHDITANHLPRATREPNSNPSPGRRLQGKRNGFSVPVNGPEELHFLCCVQNRMVSVFRQEICGNGAVESRLIQKKEQRNRHLHCLSCY